MIEKEVLTAGHGHEIHPHLTRERIPFSERHFSTVYLYRQAHEWMLIRDKESATPLGFIGKTHDDIRCFFPLEESLLTTKTWSRLNEWLVSQEDVAILYPLREKTARTLSLQGFDIQTLPEDGDYLMSRAAIATYRGRALDGRRNQVRQFMRQGKTELKALSDETQHDACTVLEVWSRFREDDITLAHEKKAAREGVLEYRRLGIEGWVAYLNEHPVALWYGQPLTEDTYLIHCTKAHPQIRGAYQFIHQEAAQRLSNAFKYINWEQDLGIQGLRKSKLAYEPASFINKWRVTVSTHGIQKVSH